MARADGHDKGEPEEVSERARVLHLLCALQCSWEDPTTSAVYVDQRAALLQRLAGIATPWRDAEKQLFVLAMQEGERSMQLLVAQKNDVAEKLHALQCRRKMAGYVPPTRTSRPRRTY